MKWTGGRDSAGRVPVSSGAAHAPSRTHSAPKNSPWGEVLTPVYSLTAVLLTRQVRQSAFCNADPICPAPPSDKVQGGISPRDFALCASGSHTHVATTGSGHPTYYQFVLMRQRGELQEWPRTRRSEGWSLERGRGGRFRRKSEEPTQGSPREDRGVGSRLGKPPWTAWVYPLHCNRGPGGGEDGNQDTWPTGLV